VADDGWHPYWTITTPIGGSRVPTWFARVRPWLALAGVAAILGALLPPVASYARHDEFAESLQFVIFATAGPALLVLGAPWRVLRLSRRPEPGLARQQPPAGLADRIARSRSRRPGVVRASAVLVTFIAAAIGWRLPVTVTALAREPGLAAAEMVTLVAAGSAVWLELVESPPLLPRLLRPQRAAVAALSMWSIWVLAYLMGLSHVAWSAAFSHAPGHGLSTAADQQIAAGVMWAVPALCFVPVIYAVLITWLRDSEDPDEELRRASAGDPEGTAAHSWPRPPRGWHTPSA
jgi:cytochrome c oxidase assembly factor CtaG